MTNYRALVPNGFFWDGSITDKQGVKVPVSIRANNPGAVNGAAWEREFSGYVTEIKYDGKNNTTIFEAPEIGVAVYWDLLRRYREMERTTVWQILERYIGPAGVADYFNSVHSRTGLDKNAVINIDDDNSLLPFAKAQFRHEAGKDIPWSDKQILYGFALGRAHAKGLPPPPIDGTTVVLSQPVAPPVAVAKPSFWQMLAKLFSRTAPTPAPAPTASIPVGGLLKYGDRGPAVIALQRRLVQLGLLLPDQVDGDFGEKTRNAVKQFQLSRNLDPDGEVGPLTQGELNAPDANRPKPPSAPPPTSWERPPWYAAAEKDIGFHEIGENRGIEKFIIASKVGSVQDYLGQPYCAIWVNAKLEDAGIPGSRSGMARSFEHNDNFVRLSAPALGAIVTNWRGSPSSGQGHVFFYDGENSSGVRGIGANEDDQIKRSFHPRERITGYWWPKSVPLPKVGKIIVGAGGDVVRTET